MMSVFYLIFVCMTAYFSFRYDAIEEYDAHKQHRLWLVCGYLICLSGFSYGLGGDKFTYMEEFENYPTEFSEAGDYIWLHFLLKAQMPLWTLVNVVGKVVFDSFYFVQLIEAAAINIAVCYIVSKYTHRYFLFLLVYFFTLQFFVFNTEVMREGFAMSFALIGMHAWMCGRRWLCLALFLMGLLFHVSIAVAFIFPFAKMRISWKTLAVAVSVAFGIWLFSDLMLGRVMMAVLGGMGAMVEKVLIYSLQASTIFGFIRSVITYLVFPFIIMYTSLQMEPSDEMKVRKEKIMSFMVLLGVLASAFAGFTRVYNYVEFFYLIMLTDFIYTMFRTKRLLIVRLGTLAGTVLLLFLQYRIYYKTTDTYYYDFFFPYTCILDETQDVYIRELAHQEAVANEVEDNNVREIK